MIWDCPCQFQNLHCHNTQYKKAAHWRKPDGLFVIQPEEIDAFLLPLPVGRLPGVGKCLPMPAAMA
jgi:hypothetical protein